MVRISPQLVRHDPGRFVLSTADDSILVIDDAAGSADSTATGKLIAMAAAGGRAAVIAALAEAESALPAAAAIVADGDEIQVAVFGDLVIDAWTDRVAVSITSLGGGIEAVALPAETAAVAITRRGDEPLAAGAGTGAPRAPVRAGRVRVALRAEGDHRLDLDRGSPANLVPPPVVAASSGESPRPTSTAAPDQVRPERVQVYGVSCPREHHNHPNTRYCVQCGLRMGVNQTLHAGLGPRPTLGLLMLDDGTSYAVDVDMVVGREPELHADVVSGAAAALTVGDPELSMSRAHFAVRLVEWHVTVVDLDSSNGTALRRDGHDDWVRLGAAEVVTVSSGDTLRAGSREFRVELHHE